ncbi:MAG: hypothetical protein IPK73_08395 [Candidatus Obscuribacter sp.]|nr:hypothetical protein [Candidatus Obscuribacter sp.]MBK9279622.1 hypothetical protein [Candidatus Obscuribacter sp.]
MSFLRVPKEAIPAIQTLITLDQDTWSSFLSELSTPGEFVSVESFQDSINSRNIPVPTVTQIVQLIYGLRMVAEDTGMPVSAIASTVVKSLKNMESFLETSEKEWKLLTVRIEAMLEPSLPLSILVRAKNLIEDNPHSFSGSRVITDIRPVFGKSADGAPVAFTIVHSLKIKYAENFEQKEFFVVMDGKDLDVLQETLNRARVKAESIERTLASTGVRLLNISGEEA